MGASMNAYSPDGRRLEEVGRLIGGNRVEVGGSGVKVGEGGRVLVEGIPVWRADCAGPVSSASALTWMASIPMRPGSAIPRAKRRR
jgi:hypothetical protein